MNFINCIGECPKLKSIKNGHVTVEEGVTGLKARYSCDENYSLSGVSLRACFEKVKSQWSGGDPMCISKSI